ncbi:MAG: twin-arginine translocation signal domain-containing protein [Salinibacter sp.]
MSRDTSRRTFLKQAGSALAATTVGVPSVLLPDRDESLGVALCGLGSYASGQLAPGLQKTKHRELRGILRQVDELPGRAVHRRLVSAPAVPGLLGRPGADQ